jgi:hypothetical protein
MDPDNGAGNERSNLDFIDGFSSAEIALVVRDLRRCDLRNIDFDRLGTIGLWCSDDGVTAASDEHPQAGSN